MNKGFLLVLMQPPPTLEEEFNAWYDTEHLAERLAVPGFETALRYVCIDGAPRYLAVYDLASPDVLNSPAYLKVAFDNASPWTKRVTSRVRIYRSAGEQIYPGTKRTGTAARVLVLRFRALPSARRNTIIAGMRKNFETRPETQQVRVLAYDTGAGVDFLGLVEASAPLLDVRKMVDKPFATDRSPLRSGEGLGVRDRAEGSMGGTLDLEAFGECRNALDLVNTYSPYT